MTATKVEVPASTKTGVGSLEPAPDPAIKYWLIVRRICGQEEKWSTSQECRDGSTEAAITPHCGDVYSGAILKLSPGPFSTTTVDVSKE
jgi:hypothetical protein